MLIGANRHRRMGKIGDRHQERHHRCIQFGDLTVKLLDLFAVSAHVLHDRCQRFIGSTGFSGSTDLLADGIAQRFLFLNLCKQLPALLVLKKKSIDIAAIENAASTISNINNQLTDTLRTSRATVQSLGAVWSGQACDATISAYNAFESKYSQLYRDMLEQYSKFLKNTAAQEWGQTEEKGKQLADTI